MRRTVYRLKLLLLSEMCVPMRQCGENRRGHDLCHVTVNMAVRPWPSRQWL